MLRGLLIWFLVAASGVLALDRENFSEICEKMIVQETEKIQSSDPVLMGTLAEAYASRGESFLLMGDDQSALNDFCSAYAHAVNCPNEQELVFRSLLGTFLVSVRQEDLETAKDIGLHLQSVIKQSLCEECESSPSLHFVAQSNWPIQGEDHIPIYECLDRVEATTDMLYMLIAAVRKTEVRMLAMTVINSLSEQAARCCRAGGLWKGCLQKLVNKLHYWKVLGIPKDPSWDD